jgi:ribose transport system permease protein
MTEVKATPVASGPAETSSAFAALRSAVSRGLAVHRLSGVYLLAALVVAFLLWEPSTFGTSSNARVVLGGQAITGVIAFAACISLISGVFDLSIGANMSLAISVVAQLQADFHVNPLLAIVLTLLLGAVIGGANAIAVVGFGMDPVIATLAMSSVLAAAAYWVASGQTILQGISPNFIKFGTSEPGGVPVTVIIMLITGLVLWYVLEQTVLGRYLYAAGANPEATRLAGVNVRRLRVGTLIVSGILASAAGVLLTMQLGAAAFDAGTPYLLPAYAAAFLGSTQIWPGRFSIPGTIVAMYLVGVAVNGLQLRFPASPWISDLVEGVTLLIAVGLAVVTLRRRPGHRA